MTANKRRNTALRNKVWGINKETKTLEQEIGDHLGIGWLEVYGWLQGRDWNDLCLNQLELFLIGRIAI